MASVSNKCLLSFARTQWAKWKLLAVWDTERQQISHPQKYWSSLSDNTAAWTHFAVKQYVWFPCLLVWPTGSWVNQMLGVKGNGSIIGHYVKSNLKIRIFNANIFHFNNTLFIVPSPSGSRENGVYPNMHWKSGKQEPGASCINSEHVLKGCVWCFSRTHGPLTWVCVDRASHRRPATVYQPWECTACTKNSPALKSTKTHQMFQNNISTPVMVLCQWSSLWKCIIPN